jgi:hypothetical protein
LLLSLGMSAIIVNYSIEIITNPFHQEKLFLVLIVLIFFLLTLTWLVLGEVKNKFKIVKFSDEKISVTKMGGLLPTKEFNSDEIDGWKYSILTSKGGNDEYLYLYINGKKIAKIS